MLPTSACASLDLCDPDGLLDPLPDLAPDLDAASRPAGWIGRRQHLAFELARLDRLHQAARTRPQLWQRAISGRQTAVGLWLYSVAVGVLAQGLPEAALALLDVLPGIDGGCGGKRALLAELVLATCPTCDGLRRAA